MFVTGQKVICIDGKFEPEVLPFYVALPREGGIYVVRGLAPANDIRMNDELAVYLIGVHNPCSNVAPFRERGFKADRFRALQEMTEEEILAITQPELVPLIEVHEPVSTDVS